MSRITTTEFGTSTLENGEYQLSTPMPNKRRYLLYYNVQDDEFHRFPSDEIEDNEITRVSKGSIHKKNSHETHSWELIRLCKVLNLDQMVFIHPINQMFATCGSEYDLDLEYCEQNNIHYTFDVRSGGTIVLFPGDILISCSYVASDDTYAQKLMTDFSNWLINKGLSARIDGNDILIDDDFKVCAFHSSSGGQEYNDVQLLAATFNINSNVEVIRNICTKPMLKIPIALSNYNITSDEVLNWLKDWFINNIPE